MWWPSGPLVSVHALPRWSHMYDEVTMKEQEPTSCKHGIYLVHFPRRILWAMPFYTSFSLVYKPGPIWTARLSLMLHTSQYILLWTWSLFFFLTGFMSSIYAGSSRTWHYDWISYAGGKPRQVMKAFDWQATVAFPDCLWSLVATFTSHLWRHTILCRVKWSACQGWWMMVLSYEREEMG